MINLELRDKGDPVDSATRLDDLGYKICELGTVVSENMILQYCLEAYPRKHHSEKTGAGYGSCGTRKTRCSNLESISKAEKKSKCLANPYW